MSATVHRRAARAATVVACAFAFGCGSDSPEKLVASAKALLDKRDLRGAEIQLKSALQKQPTLAEARYLLGATLLQAGDFPSAEKELRRALEYQFSPDPVYPLLAQAALRGAGDVDTLRKRIAEFRDVKVADTTGQAQILAELGTAYLAARQPDDAKAAFTAALAQRSEHPPARIGLARLAAAAGDIDGAMQVTADVLATTPGMVEALLLKADLHLVRGENEAALEALRAVVKLEPKNGAARYGIAILLLRERRLDEAATEAAAMKKALPRDIRATYLEGLISFRRGEPAKAKDLILQVLKVAPDHPPSQLLGGAIAYQLGEYASADEQLRKVLARFPRSGYARGLLALTYLRLGQPGRAEEVIAPAVAAASQDAAILSIAGQVAIANNNGKKATEYFERAAGASQEDARMRVRLGAVRLVTGDTEGAMRDLESAAALKPDAIEPELGLIAVLLSRREGDRALAVADRLVEKHPKSAMAVNIRGQVLLARNDAAGARASFEKALELQPDFLPAAASLARLDLAQGQPAAARKRLESVAEKTPKNDIPLLALAEVQAQTGAPLKEVMATVDRAVAANPSGSRARVAQVNLKLRNNDPKGALVAAQAAAAALPDDPAVVEVLGRVQVVAGEANQAVSTFNRLATMQPYSPAPLLLVARAQVASKNPDAAAQTLQKALALAPDRLDVRAQLIASYLGSGKAEQALADARAVQKARPKEAIGFAFEGEVLAAEKKFGPAASAYAEVLKRERAPLHALRHAELLEAAGRKADADAALARWQRENPKDVVVPGAIADRRLVEKNYKAAAAGYREILAVEPDNPTALNNLAWTLHQMNDPAALEYAEKAVARAPRSPQVADTLGVILVERGETQRGREVLARAAQEAPGALNIRLHYAKALIKSGDKAAARKELEVVAAAPGESPHKTEAADLLKQL